MKKLILLILLLAMAAANATAARMYPAGGRVVDEQGHPEKPNNRHIFN